MLQRKPNCLTLWPLGSGSSSASANISNYHKLSRRSVLGVKDSRTKGLGLISDEKPRAMGIKNPGLSKARDVVEELEDELSKILGLEELKTELRLWAKGFLLDEKRRAIGAELVPVVPPHMIFIGNPGTGKTTMARIIGNLLKHTGVLSNGRVVEVQRSDLESRHDTYSKIEQAMGGVLFVNEASRLGKKALKEIKSALGKHDLLVILADNVEPEYSNLSCEGFSRTLFVDIRSCEELAAIVMIKMSKHNTNNSRGFKLHPLCTFEAICQVIENNSSEELRSKLNGHLVDVMLSNARKNMDSRLSIDSDNGDELMTITLEDLNVGLQLLAQSVMMV